MAARATARAAALGGFWAHMAPTQTKSQGMVREEECRQRQEAAKSTSSSRRTRQKISLWCSEPGFFTPLLACRPAHPPLACCVDALSQQAGQISEHHSSFFQCGSTSRRLPSTLCHRASWSKRSQQSTYKLGGVAGRVGSSGRVACRGREAQGPCRQSRHAGCYRPATHSLELHSPSLPNLAHPAWRTSSSGAPPRQPAAGQTRARPGWRPRRRHVACPTRQGHAAQARQACHAARLPAAAHPASERLPRQMQPPPLPPAAATLGPASPAPLPVRCQLAADQTLPAASARRWRQRTAADQLRQAPVGPPPPRQLRPCGAVAAAAAPLPALTASRSAARAAAAAPPAHSAAAPRRWAAHLGGWPAAAPPPPLLQAPASAARAPRVPPHRAASSRPGTAGRGRAAQKCGAWCRWLAP